MKKIVVLLFLFCSLSLSGQNIQFLTNGKLNFATFEIYKPLEHGTFYYFNDFKMSKNGVDESYSEVSGYFNVSKTISITGQYNAGLNKHFTIFPVYLFGVSKSFSIKEQLKLSVDILFRYQNYLYLSKEKQKGYQITISFNEDIKKFQICGYCDFWNTKYIIFEPQGWYNVFNNIWIGAECRLSNYTDVLNYDSQYKFIGNYSNYIMAGLKWNISQ